MTSIARKRSRSFTFLFLAVLIGLPIWLVYHLVRQEQLNHAMIVAIKQGDAAKSWACLNAGADVNATDMGERPVSAQQVLRGWFDRLRGRQSLSRQVFPTPALLLALHAGFAQPEEFTPLARALVERGADPNARDAFGNTGLILAADFGDTSLARLMLDRGADINAHNQEGATALMMAGGRQPTGMIELLIDRGADVHAGDNKGETALTRVLIDGCYESGIARLLQAGADVNARDQDGWTALMYAARYGETANVQRLLDRGADVTMKNRDGATALTLADGSGPQDCVHLLRQAVATRQAAR